MASKSIVLCRLEVPYILALFDVSRQVTAGKSSKDVSWIRVTPLLRAKWKFIRCYFDHSRQITFECCMRCQPGSSSILGWHNTEVFADPPTHLLEIHLAVPK